MYWMVNAKVANSQKSNNMANLKTAQEYYIISVS